MPEPDDLPTAPLQFETKGVHAGLIRKENEVKNAAIYASTSFVFENSAHGAAIFSMNAEAFCYSRIGNPTLDVFEKRMTALEGGEAALATSSGAAAIFITAIALAKIGDNIVVTSPLSGPGTHIFKHRLPPLGITARFVENGNELEVRAAIDKDTKFVFAESISSNELLVSDIGTLATTAHEAGIPLIVDNTASAGGYLLRPIEYGADIVVESAAEWLSISGSSSGGIIIDSGKFDWKANKSRYPQFFEPSPGFHGLRWWDKFLNLSFVSYARAAIMRDTGPCLNPFEAFQLIAGLETLSVRMERISNNALKLAEWFSNRGEVVDFRYPGHSSTSQYALSSKYLKRGYGGLLSISFKGNSEFIEQLLHRLKLVSLGQSIGGSKTILIPQPNEDQQENGKSEGELRQTVWISVGLENIDDIISDFEHALSAKLALR